MTTKRTVENVTEARKMIAAGLSRKDVMARFGISEGTVRCWLDDAVYARHTANAAAWQKRNAALLNERNRIRNRNLSDGQRSKRNLKQREAYVSNPRVKERMRGLMAKYRNTGQGAVAAVVRRSLLGFAGRYNPTYTGFMEAATGMSMDAFTKRFTGRGHFDHITPLCAFDLTNPEHLVRAVHLSNVRLVPRKENESKGGKYPEGLDVMSLPWSHNSDALVQAKTLISRALARLKQTEEVTA